MLCGPILAMPDSVNRTAEALPSPQALIQNWPIEALPSAQSLVPERSIEALPQALALAAPERSSEDEYNYKVKESNSKLQQRYVYKVMKYN